LPPIFVEERERLRGENEKQIYGEEDEFGAVMDVNVAVNEGAIGRMWCYI